MSDAALDCEVVQTRSGAPAMLDRVTGEVMHPVVGPIVEVDTLYLTPSRLAARLQASTTEPLVLFDVGLGAGSNALAAWRLSEALASNARRLEIVSFDRSVEALRLACSPQHASTFGFDASAVGAARGLLAAGRHETPRTRWTLQLGSLPDTFAAQSSASVDVVFWDPFSPKANPELWTVGAFSALRRVCRAGATVHTYSRATATRSALLLAGFAVGYGAITGADKPTTTASVDPCDLEQPLDRRWLERLGRSSAPWPADAPAGARKALEALPQFTNSASTPSP